MDVSMKWDTINEATNEGGDSITWQERNTNKEVGLLVTIRWDLR